MADVVLLYIRTNMPDLDRAGVAHVVVLCKSEKTCSPSYVAYTGIVRIGSPTHRLAEVQLKMKADRVAALGTKLSFEQAVSYFPALKRSQYRVK